MAEKIAVVPGRSLGSIALGMRREALPKACTVSNDVGALGPIGFSLTNDVVDDAWLDELESRPVLIEVNHLVIDPRASLAEWEKVLGPCERLDDVIGGTFYNCRAGLSLGFNIDGILSQIRLKRR